MYAIRSYYVLLASLINSDASPLNINGLKGGGLAFVAAKILKETGKHQVFVFNEKEEAAYFYNDLQKLADGFEAEFFPSIYQRSIQYGKVDNGNILIRTDILGRISNSNKPFAFITYPESFIEKVVSAAELKSNTFQIRKGDSLSRNFLVEVLTEYSFDVITSYSIHYTKLYELTVYVNKHGSNYLTSI